MPRCYVVYRGRVPGVYTEWAEVHEQVNRFPGNSHRSFPSETLARASYLEFLRKKNKMRNRIFLVLLLLMLIAFLYVILV